MSNVKKRLDRRGVVLLCLWAASACAESDQSAVPVPAFGHPDSVLFWTPEQQLAGFPNYDVLFDTRLVPASTSPFVLEANLRDPADIGYQIDGVDFALADFMEQNHVKGLIVVHRDSVVLEEYRGDNDASTRWVSYSVAKSVVSLLIGAAIADGYIDGVDDLVTDYVPLLEGSGYDGVRIRDLLQMSSGVDWNEDYTDPSADVSREIGLPDLERLNFLSTKDRVAPPGERFNYSTGETHLAGAVLRSAIDGYLADYLHQKVWEPFGMEADANWRLVEPDGAEHGGCCISATLRDYARLGLFALKGGVPPSGGGSALADGWMEASTTPSAGFDGYGYLWWLSPAPGYSASGIFGQLIYIDPELDLVIATHSAWPVPTGSEYSARRTAFIEGVRRWVEQ